MFVWLWWFIFNPVVLFLSPSYARKAKERGFKNAAGRPQTARYWVPFWFTLIQYAAGAALIVWLVTSAHSVSSSYSSYTPYTTPTTTQQPYSSSTTGNHFDYAVTQQSGAAMTVAHHILNGTNTTWMHDSSINATSALCEVSHNSNYPYNCNVALSNQNGGSYWVTWDGTQIHAWVRNHQ